MCAIFRGKYIWEEKIRWLDLHSKTDSFEHQFKRLVFFVIVYEQWKAKNIGLFQLKFLNSVVVMSTIVDVVQHVMWSWSEISRSKVNYKLALE